MVIIMASSFGNGLLNLCFGVAGGLAAAILARNKNSKIGGGEINRLYDDDNIIMADKEEEEDNGNNKGEICKVIRRSGFGRPTIENLSKSIECELFRIKFPDEDDDDKFPKLWLFGNIKERLVEQEQHGGGGGEIKAGPDENKGIDRNYYYNSNAVVSNFPLKIYVAKCDDGASTAILGLLFVLDDEAESVRARHKSAEAVVDDAERRRLYIPRPEV